MHPSDAIRGSTSDRLAGRTIVLGVTGSIAAVRAVEIAREIVRHGARVIPVMTPAATRIVGADALEFATGAKPVTTLSGQVEHVRDKDADLLLVAPATGNTVSKMALGIDDTPVTTYFTARPDKTSVIVAPAMHATMYDSPFLQENLRRLRSAGVTVLDPWFEEGKAKLPEPTEIVEHVLRRLGPRTLAGKRILVVNGSTVEPIDEMRVVTNKSTGRMGAALAEEAFRLGADVEHWFGHGHLEHVPAHVKTRRFVTVADLVKLAGSTRQFDAILVPAAISDYGPATEKGKIPSEKGALTLHLEPLPKFVATLRETFPGALVTFKAETGVDERALVERARRSLATNRALFVVANDLKDVTPDATRVLVVDAKRASPVTGSKHDVARAILTRLAEELRK